MAYVNLNEENERHTSANYRGNLETLIAVKRQYDPRKLLRLNANIDPA